MSSVSVVKSLMKSTPRLAIMSSSLFWMYLTLGWKVRKARKVFENELVSQGMSAKDAKRLSQCFNELKNSLTIVVRNGITGGFMVRSGWNSSISP
jgi:hypothetical protein